MSDLNDENKLLTIREAARIVNLDHNIISILCRYNAIPNEVKGRMRFIRRIDLDSWNIKRQMINQ